MDKIDKKNIEDILALTPMQEGMLFHYLKDPGGDQYFEQLSLDICAEIELDIFERAWNAVIETNEMLRVVFRWQKIESPLQIVQKEQKLKLAYHDLSSRNAGEKHRCLEDISAGDKEEKFDLREIAFRVILCKVEKDKYRMLISNHHILYDGWSNGIILKEFFAAYNDISKGKQPIKPVKTKFKEFVKWIRDQDVNAQADYWREYLAGFDTQAALAVKKRKAKKIIHIESYQIRFEENLRGKLEDFIKSRKITLASFLYCAWGLLLQKYNNTGDVIFGTTVSGRTAKVPGVEDIVGLFINTIPLRIRTLAHEKIGDLLYRVSGELQMRGEYEHTPLVNIKEYSETASTEELFDSIAVMENYPFDRFLMLEKSQIALEDYSISETPHYDLALSIKVFAEIEFALVYNKELFDEDTMTRLALHFKRIMNEMLSNPGKRVSGLEILSEEEKGIILNEFNKRSDYPAGKTIPPLFEGQAGRTPGNIALVDMDTGPGTNSYQPLNGIQLTYQELDNNANRLAYFLRAKGVKAGEMLALMVERSIDMILGILGILKAGAAYVPINPKNPCSRIHYLVQDCSIKLLLTSQDLWKEVEQLRSLGIHVLSIQECRGETGYSAPETATGHWPLAADIAYIIYTSGSTGKPKGVPISHSNLSPLLHWGYRHLGIGAADRTVQNLACYFDWSVWEIFITLTSGAALHIVPEEVMLDSQRYTDFINRHGITVLHITPTHFQSFIQLHQQRKLNTLRYLCIGGEKLTCDLVERSRALVHEDCRLFNMYGPTETTIMATVLEIDGSKLSYYKELSSVPIGGPIANLDLLVLDRDMNLCPIHVPGELYIRGSGVASGYLNNPELTADRFKESGQGGTRLYFSGDCCRWLADGTIEFLGRLDNQVKLRGFRIEPGEIEKQLLAHQDVKEALVMVREYEQGEKYLCAYVVLHSSCPPKALQEYLARHIPDYMIPSYFIPLERMPLNPNGKVDIKALPEPTITSARTYIAPRNDTEEALVDIWARVLRIPGTRIGIADDFFALGGHSLNITSLVGLIHKELNIEVPFAQIFVSPTVTAMADYISRQEERQYDEIPPVEEKEYYPLSSAQKRLFVLQMMEADCIAYNIHGIMLLEGQVEKERFEKVFRRLIARHESLRTSFSTLGGEPVQRIHQPRQIKFDIENIECYEPVISVEPGGEQCSPPGPAAQPINRFIRAFDLSCPPLLRVYLIREAETRHILLVDMHHIITDGASINLVIKEFAALYAGEEIGVLRLQYRDYSQWHNSDRQREVVEKQAGYWLKEYSGEVPVLNLPADYARPGIQSFAGRTLASGLSLKQVRELNSLALNTGTTLFMVLLGVYNVFLSKISGQQDIIVGTPVAARRHADLERIVGMFVNTLALRNYPCGQKRFRDFLQELKERTLEAFENQEYQFEDLVDRVVVSRDVSRNPLFDTMFTVPNLESPTEGLPKVEVPGLRVKPYEVEDRTSKFDLALTCVQTGAGMYCSFGYCTRLFKRETIERFFSYFKQVLSFVVSDPDVRLCQIEIISEAEKRQLVFDFNDTRRDYPKDKTIHEQFEEQSQRTPGYIAIAGEGLEPGRVKGEGIYLSSCRVSLTFRQLDEQANELALLLKEKGVRPGIIVGIMLARSIDMITGLLAVLKLGGAYLPIEPAYPQERIDYMLFDSEASLVLTRGQIYKGCGVPGNWQGDTVFVEDIAIRQGPSGIHRHLPLSAGCRLPAAALAYIIYTSGTSGRPKGVMIEHRNVVRLVRNSNFIRFTRDDRLLLTGTMVFDITTFEIWGPLLNGVTLHLVEQDLILAGERLADVLYKDKISILHLIPQLFNQLAGQDPGIFARLRYFLVGGDLVQSHYVNKIRNRYKDVKILHMYGPTENTTFSTFLPVEKDYETSIPIGKPIANSTVYIVARDDHLQPVGVPGELWLGGDGVGRGYLNNPELTHDKFSLSLPETSLGRLYHTGDLARWEADGTIEFLGRIDQQVKIRGFRIELGEIENRLLSHETVKEAVVIDRVTGEGDKYLCAYVVAGSVGPQHAAADVVKLREFLSRTLPDYMIPSYIVALDKIPLTPNGKVDRKALPEPVVSAGQEYVAPRNVLEEKLAFLWSEVLQSSRPIGIDDNFFEIGGHSLKASLLMSRIHQAFDVNLHLSEIFVHPTLRHLAAVIEASVKDRFSAIEPVEEKEYYPLSSAQKRLYLLYQMDPASTAYNIPVLMDVQGEIDKQRFEDTFWKLIRRHESLRTSFHMVNEESVQRIHDRVEFKIEYYGMDQGAESTIKNFIRPFDLSQALLLRVGLIKEEGQKHILVMDIHHIISDGASMEVLIEDFVSFYREDHLLPFLRIQYKDYTGWHNRQRGAEFTKRQEAFWVEEFAGEIPVLQFPADFNRPAIQGFAGRTPVFELGKEETTQLKRLALEEGATLFMILLSFYYILLSKLSTQEDIAIGTPVAGRRHADLAPVMGMFVNTLALRNYPAGEKTFKNFLREVKDNTLAALKNQDYPFEGLVEKLEVSRDASRNPLFDAAFALQRLDISGMDIPGLKLRPFPYDSRISKFDLTFNCQETGENLLIHVEYSTRLFLENTIKRFINYFNRIVSAVIENMEIRLGEIEVISAEEQKQILFHFNRFEPGYVRDKTLPQLFEEQAERSPDNTAVVGKVQGLWRQHLTYRKLKEESYCLAHYLCSRGVMAGDLVAFELERSAAMIIAVLGILKAGAGYVPLNPKAPWARTTYILDECDVNILLTSRDLLAANEKPGTWQGETIFIREWSAAPFEHQHVPPVPATSLAYIIFTSGSTGVPKGVPITHANLSPLLHWGYRHLGIGPQERTIQNLSCFFDWSVWEIFITLTSGASLYTAPEEVSLAPGLCIEFIAKNVITVLHITPTQYHYLVNTGRRTDTLRYLFIGAEKLTHELVRRSFAAVSPNCRVFNMYGPTEATIISAVLEIQRSSYEHFGSLSSVPIGKPTGNTDLFILDKYLKLCPVNTTGELYIAGDGLARGYLNDPEKSRNCFVPNIYQARGSGGERLYKTGDLARWLEGGSVEYLGRIDQQVKIRGFRIELAEIENRLLSHETVKEAVVIDRVTGEGDKYLCAYVVAGSVGPQHAAAGVVKLREFLSRTLPDYMIPSYIVALDKIPLTPNGKLDRKALPEPVVGAGQEYVAPRNVLEEKLAFLWSEVLQSSRPIGIDDNFFEIGGHSLKASLLMSRIHQAFDVNLHLSKIFVHPTLRHLAAVIEASVKDRFSAIEPVEEKEYYPLSSAQKRLYLLYQMDPASIGYNIPVLMEVQGEIDKQGFEDTFWKLIRRHESLRTSFHMVNEESVQRIHDRVEFEIEYYGMDQGAESTIKNFIRPFDLSQAPLLRVGLIKTADEEHILVMDIHHIISDGASMGVLIKGFISFYEGKELPVLLVQYKDYSKWQNREQEGEALKKQGAFWLKEFEDEIPVLALPTDYPRPALQSFAGSQLSFELSGEETKRLNQVARSREATLFMVLLAACNIFLSRLSGQEEIVLGCPVAGRRHADLQGIIGMFVNTLALRNYPRRDKTFGDFLKDVKVNALKAFENQDYQFEELVEKVSINRDASRNPLFDVVFALQDAALHELEIPALKLQPYDIENLMGISKFDLTIIAAEQAEGLFFGVEYCTKLFKSETVKGFTGFFKRVISSVIVDPGIKIGEIEILGQQEKEQVLHEFNNTAAPYPADSMIHQLFEDQAAKTPGRTGVVFEDQSLSYQELNERADRLSSLLCQKGGVAEAAVGITARHSPEMIIGVLAILKAGGAYLPINPDYPRARKEYLLKDSCASILLTTGYTDFTDYRVKEYFGKISIMALSLPVKAAHMRSLPRHRPSTFGNRPATAALAYIIYTSGSTGRPKGVLVTHRNVIRLVKNTNYIEFRESQRLLQTGALEFDASTFEIWGSLLNGLTLCLAEKEKILAADRLKENILRYDIAIMWLTAPLFNQMIQLDIAVFSGLKHLFVGGDVLSPVHINRLKRRFPCLKVSNGYGPTENTTFSTTYLIDREYTESIPIGAPIANSTVYIVDKENHLQPVGVAGGLLVGGEGVARGYLNDPAMTADKFIRSPASIPQVQPSLTGGQYPMSLDPNIPSRQHSIIPGVERSAAKFYRTGDLARWLPDGNVEFLGRIDFQLKIRGFRVELGEIENRLLDYAGIKEALVVVKENKSHEKYLCAYIVTGQPFEQSELKEVLSKDLPEYMIPAYFIRLGRMPLTANGKIDRQALPEPVFEAGMDHAVPTDEIEERLLQIWSEILGIEEEHLGINADFFQLGGHSLTAARMTAKVDKELDVKVPLAEVFTTPTIRGLAGFIKGAAKGKFSPIKSAEEREYYPLSSAQKRLFLLQHMVPGSIAYNVPSVMRVEGNLTRGKLKDIFLQLICRHESLRTSFHMVNEEPVQKIHDSVEFKIEYYGMDQGAESTIKNFIHPFDLSQAPLLRVSLIKEEEQKHILMMDMHHIISDGTSIGVLVEEFISFYEGKELPGLLVQYKDYSEWQNREQVGEALKKQEAFWLKEFEEEIPVLALPTDFLRPKVQSFSGNTLKFEIDSKNTQALRDLALSQGATLFMVLLSIYDVFLSKLSGQEVVVVGTSTAGRRHADLAQVIGMFVNTLALKNEPAGERSFKEFLGELRGKTLAAFANQDYQYEELVDKAAVNRDTSRNPLFDTMFAFQNLDIPTIVVPGLKLTPYPYERRIAKFDLMLQCDDTGDCLSLLFEYCTKLFRAETIERFIGYFKKILGQVLETPDEKIGALEIISKEERSRLLFDFNRSAAEYPRYKTVHQLFEEQVERIPDHIVISKRETVVSVSLTFRELNEKANQLARILRQEGITSDSVVGLLVEPCVQMMIGIMGILKAGGAYLPIDPNIPAGRVAYMVNDAALSVLLSTNPAPGEIAFKGRLVDLRRQVLFKGPRHNPVYECRPKDLAYVIYTSGSTGRPKGAAVEHSQLVNFVYHMYNRYNQQVDCRDRCLGLTNIMFDVSVWELFLPLVFGARLVLLPEQKRFDVFALAEAVLQEEITLIYIPPGLLKPVNEQLKKQPGRVRLNKMLVGVEPIRDEVLEDYVRLTSKIQIINGYGPTETTICASSYNYLSHEPQGEIVPIGVPLSNNQVVLLDAADRVVPRGTVGEICISGDGVSRGYINNPELSADKYSPHPYFKEKSMYRTGDLARLLPDGNIRFIGRRDQQLKIRGYRIELGEIENRLLRHQDIKQALVLAQADKKGGKYLCAYVVTDTRLETSELRKYLARDLPDYMIPSYFVPLERIPLTPNGKVDKKALPAADVGAAPQDYIAPRDKLEMKLAELWSDVLGVEKGMIGIDSDFFDLGGHSLKANLLVSKVNRDLNVKIPLTEIFAAPSIRGLAEFIKASAQDRSFCIEAAEEREYYPLSSAQERLYVVQHMEEKSTAYNMPALLLAEGDIAEEKLADTFLALIRRHESLRTSFMMLGPEPVQKIHKAWEIEFTIESHQVGGTDPGARHDFIRAFDLSRAPLLRVGLARIKEKQSILMVDMHHIISDGFSMDILLREFIQLHAGEEPGPIKLHYKDYSQWQTSDTRRQDVQRQQVYWWKQFQGEIPVLNLPADFDRPPTQTFAGSSVPFKIDAEETKALNRMARQEEATLYMVLLAILDVLLSRLTGQEDIIIGAAVEGRRHADLERTIGMFINTLALRNYPEGEKSFREFLGDVKKTTLAAFDNQDYQFEDLVDDLGINRSSPGNPLFNVMFELNNIQSTKLEIPGLRLQPYPYEHTTAKFDMTLYALESGEELVFSFVYSTELFREETMQLFIKNFREIVTQVIASPDLKLSALGRITDKEKLKRLSVLTDDLEDE